MVSGQGVQGSARIVFFEFDIDGADRDLGLDHDRNPGFVIANIKQELAFVLEKALPFDDRLDEEAGKGTGLNRHGFAPVDQDLQVVGLA